MGQEVNGRIPVPSPPQAAAISPIYYVPRRFTSDSRLHNLLAQECPDIIDREKRDYNLHQVLTALKRVIAKFKLYDPQNPTVVLCDQRLEEALDVKALHVSEIREQVCKQFHPIIPQTGNTNSHPNQAIHANLPPSVPDTTSQPTPPVTERNGAIRYTFVPVHRPGPPSNFVPLVVPSSPASTALPTQEPIVLPSCASNSANGVVARQMSVAPFNIEGRYYVTPAFLRVLRQVPEVNQSQVVFPYREVADILSKYILMKKEKFFDCRNIRVALVENDPLGDAFCVKAFHRSQVTTLMRRQCAPFQEPERPESIQPPPQEPDDGIQSPSKKRKRDSDESEDETPSKRPPFKKSSRKDSSQSALSKDESESSGAETVYSDQGYDTVAIGDIKQPQEEDSDSDDYDSIDDSNHEDRFRATYRVEYEIDSGSDQDKENGNDSSDYSEHEAVVVSRVSAKDPDFFYLAESESEDDDESFDDTRFPNLSKENLPSCQGCQQPNPSCVRFCDPCWKGRNAKVPQRENAKKRKREAFLKKDSPSKRMKFENTLQAKGLSEPESGIPFQKSLFEWVSERLNLSVFLTDLAKKISKEPCPLLENMSIQEVVEKIFPPIEQQAGLPKTADLDWFPKDTRASSSAPSVACANELCNVCQTKPKDGLFVHGYLAHQYACYNCAKKIFDHNRICPVCNRGIHSVVKNVVS